MAFPVRMGTTGVVSKTKEGRRLAMALPVRVGATGVVSEAEVSEEDRRLVTAHPGRTETTEVETVATESPRVVTAYLVRMEIRMAKVALMAKIEAEDHQRVTVHLIEVETVTTAIHPEVQMETQGISDTAMEVSKEEEKEKAEVQAGVTTTTRKKEVL